MTDRSPYSVGLPGRSRHRSPDSETSPERLESRASGSGVESSPTALRRRSLRPRVDPNNAPLSQVGVDSERKARPRRIGTRKDLGRDSPHLARSPKHSSGESGAERSKEKEPIGLLPKLGRILEGKENGTRRLRRDSKVSSVDSTQGRRRTRPAEDSTVSRRQPRPKHGSLQRRMNGLGELPNPSLVSVLSSFTHQSSASSGSNSTITQKSYNDQVSIARHRPITKERKQKRHSKSATSKARRMDAPRSAVFQYMDEGTGSEGFGKAETQSPRPTSSQSSSSSSSYHSEHGGASSNAEEAAVSSPLTSPEFTRRSFQHDARATNYYGHNTVSAPENTNEPSLSYPKSLHAEVHDEEDEEDEEQSDSSGNEEDRSGDAHFTHGHARHLALERAPPPRLPSATSSHGDRHTTRLRLQEQQLREHVLQPQPQRDFHFSGGLHPHHLPAMPLDPYSHSAASPDHNSHGAVPYHALEWPPPAPAPPPPPIGYYPPPHAPPGSYSPESRDSYAMASRPPMPPPSAAVVPPFHAPAHPPHYQPHPTGPDLTKTTVVGYELLAEKLAASSQGDKSASSEERIVPLYRKFEHLNHRVFLHLQDEITELEEELRCVDECIAQSSCRDESGHLYPASRRGDARYGGELHYRRTELLGRIYLKLGQYNQSLSAFSNMVKQLDAADSKDVQAYRAWMEKRAPLEHNETRFLEHKNDLLTVTRRGTTSLVGGAGGHQSDAIWLPLILVLPLMVFAMVPGLLGRLFFLAVVGAGEIKLVLSTKELLEIMTVREWCICASSYFSFMALVALVH